MICVVLIAMGREKAKACADAPKALRVASDGGARGAAVLGEWILAHAGQWLVVHLGKRRKRGDD